MNYYELTLEIQDFNHWKDIFVAYLAELEYESFVEENACLKAYIQEENFDPKATHDLIFELASKGATLVGYHVQVIVQQNWNKDWETQFEPVLISDQLRIKAPFHQLAPFNGLEVQILPKMSFGTGHHQTTHLVCQQMLSLDFNGKRVLDMGAGTGVLSILAEFLGANQIVAIEIEEWSAENIAENIVLNNCKRINAIHGGLESIPELIFDIVLANINKNILLEHLKTYASIITRGGILLLSGFFVSDAPQLVSAAEKIGFKFHGLYERENWAALHLIKIT